ncbi:putative cyclase-domain-containing protein [Phialemonium atrogriseum]|uniref:Cyclase-domain-containing protein n=1 Tax=Phialemonium atrogriseum TaxID=1093897 RepID=A0AAJ0FIC0_9PEZI|nr:putative cyclase-domain-containing protein [Phialemonium atrogriseum]KAK1761955.1 putative cyclase-domain-containing protein [Phialemonium atrogriseum]
MEPGSYPDFGDLPKVEGMPQGCAWGVFDKDGKKDLLGTLNFLTPQVVQAAAAEVKAGVSISLNWPLNAFKIPLPFRRSPTHTVVDLREAGLESDGWDDELEFNTQCSSQWDSLTHFPDQATGLAYNGAKPTKEGLSVSSTEENGLPTCEHWHARGGIVGRGVLVDYKAYAEETAQTGAVPYSPFDGHRITVQELEAVAKHQGVEFRPGDILIVRTGYTELLEGPTEALVPQLSKGTLSGVHGTEETARWVWNHRFAAVAGDSHGFEAIPPVKPDGSVAGMSDLVLHQWFLVMFGLPIGELWDLKALSAHCKKSGRYSFMLSSVPLNHPGLVASPPNALAIF